MSPVPLTTGLSFVALLISVAFVVRFSRRGWASTATGRLVMALFSVIAVFNLRAFVLRLRVLDPLWAEWWSFGLYLLLTAALVAAHVIFTSVQRAGDRITHPPRPANQVTTADEEDPPA